MSNKSFDQLSHTIRRLTQPVLLIPTLAMVSGFVLLGYLTFNPEWLVSRPRQSERVSSSQNQEWLDEWELDATDPEISSLDQYDKSAVINKSDRFVPDQTDQTQQNYQFFQQLQPKQLTKNPEQSLTSLPLNQPTSPSENNESFTDQFLGVDLPSNWRSNDPSPANSLLTNSSSDRNFNSVEKAPSENLSDQLNITNRLSLAETNFNKPLTVNQPIKLNEEPVSETEKPSNQDNVPNVYLPGLGTGKKSNASVTNNFATDSDRANLTNADLSNPNLSSLTPGEKNADIETIKLPTPSVSINQKKSLLTDIYQPTQTSPEIVPNAQLPIPRLKPENLPVTPLTVTPATPSSLLSNDLDPNYPQTRKSGNPNNNSPENLPENNLISPVVVPENSTSNQPRNNPDRSFLPAGQTVLENDFDMINNGFLGDRNEQPIVPRNSLNQE